MKKKKHNIKYQYKSSLYLLTYSYTLKFDPNIGNYQYFNPGSVFPLSNIDISRNKINIATFVALYFSTLCSVSIDISKSILTT